MLLVDNMENRGLLRELVEAMYKEPPAPKKKNLVGGVCKSDESGNAQNCNETICRRYWMRS
jgi:hypothetical protein